MSDKETLAAIQKSLADLKEMEARITKAEQKISSDDEQKANRVAMGNYVPVGNRSDSLEMKSMRYYGVSHPSKLLEVNTGHPDFRGVPDECKWFVLDLKKTVDVARMTAQICLGDPVDRERKTDSKDNLVAGNVKNVFNTYYGKHVLAPKLKALGTGVANEGAEWVPTVVSSQYIEEFELERMLARQFEQIRMPSNPFDMPIQSGVTEARVQAEGSTISQANFGTDKISFDAVKLAEFTVLPEELNEDSAPNILALKRREVSEAIGRAIEQAIINGDTSLTHQDSDTAAGAADLAAKSMDGLRRLALANSATVDFGGGAVSLANARALRVLMGKFGVRQNELMYVCSPKVYLQMTALDEVTSVERFGPQATILRGALDALDGIPIMVSEYPRDDLNAAGVHDGITTDLSVLHLVNRTRFMLGVRRPIRIRATFDPVPPNDRWLCVSWWRGDFQGHAQSATEISSALGINIG